MIKYLGYKAPSRRPSPQHQTASDHQSVIFLTRGRPGELAPPPSPHFTFCCPQPEPEQRLCSFLFPWLSKSASHNFCDTGSQHNNHSTCIQETKDLFEVSPPGSMSSWETPATVSAWNLGVMGSHRLQRGSALQLIKKTLNILRNIVFLQVP